MKSLFKESFVKNPDPIVKDDNLIQIFINERYDLYAIFNSGRVFKKRARGQSGSYDNWAEVDLRAEINNDLKL